MVPVWAWSLNQSAGNEPDPLPTPKPLVSLGADGTLAQAGRWPDDLAIGTPQASFFQLLTWLATGS